MRQSAANTINIHSCNWKTSIVQLNLINRCGGAVEWLNSLLITPKTEGLKPHMGTLFEAHFRHPPPWYCWNISESGSKPYSLTLPLIYLIFCFQSYRWVESGGEVYKAGHDTNSIDHLPYYIICWRSTCEGGVCPEAPGDSVLNAVQSICEWTSCSHSLTISFRTCSFLLTWFL